MSVRRRSRRATSVSSSISTPFRALRASGAPAPPRRPPRGGSPRCGSRPCRTVRPSPASPFALLRREGRRYTRPLACRAMRANNRGMRKRTTIGLALATALAFAPLAGHAAPAATYHAPKNGFGQPDLQGTWTNASLTSLQRPAMFKTLTLTDAEAVALEKRRAAARAVQDRP